MMDGIDQNKSQQCARYTDADCFRYSHGGMADQEAAEFEQHALTCTACLRWIREASAESIRQKDQGENDTLCRNAMAVMDRVDGSIFTIVVRAVRDAVELIRSSGELLSFAPAVAGVRSAAVDMPSVAQTLRLFKEFEDSRLSVEVVLSPVYPNMLDISVSLLDTQGEEFIAGVTVSCRGDGTILDEVTDDSGQACFRVPSSGFYELVMKKDAKTLGAMTITGV